MPLPQIKHCLICEDIRLELRNLVSLMGVYGATPYAGIEVANLKLHVAFCLVFVGDPFEGKLVIKLELRSPDGVRVEATAFPELNEQTFSRNFPVTFGFRVNAIFPRPDTYTIVVTAGGAEFFKDTFLIAQAEAKAST